MPTSRKADEETPVPEEMTRREFERQAAAADDPKQGITLQRWMETPGSLGHDKYVVAGAAALAGWKDDTELTKAEINEGVKAFLAHKPE